MQNAVTDEVFLVKAKAQKNLSGHTKFIIILCHRPHYFGRCSVIKAAKWSREEVTWVSALSAVPQIHCLHGNYACWIRLLRMSVHWSRNYAFIMFLQGAAITNYEWKALLLISKTRKWEKNWTSRHCLYMIHNTFMLSVGPVQNLYFYWKFYIKS